MVLIPGPGLIAIEIEPDSAKTESGVFLPERRDTSGERAQFGRVLGVGALLKTADGAPVSFEVRPGDRVLLKRFRGTEIRANGKSFAILPEEHILAIVS